MKKIIISPRRFGSNCYLLISDGKAFIVDPSVSVETIASALEAEGASPIGILLTHGHFDHITSIDNLRGDIIIFFKVSPPNRNISLYYITNLAESL